MISIKPTHKVLICMDSDGTVMDTMTIKHVRCFGPCFLTAFNINTNKEEILKTWNDDNLYTKTRGINRFQGLDKILEYVKQFGYTFDGYDEFHGWVTTTKEYSVNSINKALETCKDPTTFNLALYWSKIVNEEITKLPPASPFEGVEETIKEAKLDCDLVGVSSANAQAVKEEWTRLGFYDDFKEVACQDKGTKSIIIRDTLANGYDKKNTVMLGDAIGDELAAKENGVWFFPIIPGDEVASWKKFRNVGLKRMVEGSFDEAYQQELIDEFYHALEK